MPNTYNPPASGGIVVGGAPRTAVIYSLTTSGGVKIAGTAFVRQSSIVVSGSAKVSSVWYHSGAGGVICAGTGSVNIIKIASGGVRVSGSATEYVQSYLGGGVRVAGSARVEVVCSKVGTGGVRVAGAATNRGIFHPVLIGSCVVSGTAGVGLKYTIPTSGGVRIRGLAELHPTGVKVGGSAIMLCTHKPPVSGGIVAGGEAPHYWTISPQGSVLVGSSAVVTIDYRDEVGTGGVVVAGDAPWVVHRYPAIAGGVVVAGQVELHGTGVFVGGSALIEHVIPITGGVVVSGVADETVTYNINGAVHDIIARGGCRVSGTSNVYVERTLSTNGGCLVVGSGPVYTTFIPAISGGCLVNGRAVVSVTRNFTSLTSHFAGAEGGVLVGGSASDVYVNHIAYGTGGVVIAGKAEFHGTGLVASGYARVRLNNRLFIRTLEEGDLVYLLKRHKLTTAVVQEVVLDSDDTYYRLRKARMGGWLVGTSEYILVHESSVLPADETESYDLIQELFN